jgi:hypothetical protein
MRILRQILQILLPNQKTFDYREIERNDQCYCASGKKYKHCHLAILQKKGKLSLYEIDVSTGEIRVKIYSERKYKGLRTRMKTGLRGVDVKATNIALNNDCSMEDIYK